MRWNALTTLICTCICVHGCSKPEPHPEQPAARPALAAEVQDSEPAGQPAADSHEGSAPAEEKSEDSAPQQGNPAFKKCVDAKGQIKSVTESGAALDVCVFEDGSRCEVFALADGKCKPGSCKEEQGLCQE